jgi:hypothetical protein
MSHVAKRQALVFLIVALTTTLVIGTVLPRLRFQPGQPLPRPETTQGAPPPSVGSHPPVVRGNLLVFELLGILLGAFLLYRLLRGVHWKEVLSASVYILLALAAVGLLILAISLLPASRNVRVEPLPAPKAAGYSALGPAPPVLAWLIGLGLLAVLVTLAVVLLRSRPAPAIRPWAREAEAARHALLSGDNLADVIVHCYRRMSQALQQDQGLVRDEAMTTGEFERLLAAQGVPRDPVHQLTQLFEAVRYGLWRPGPGDERRALESLDAILAYSREPTKGGSP